MSDTDHATDDHGHGHAAAPQFDIIKENSAVDTFLTDYACTIALVILIIFGGSMFKSHPVEEGRTHGSHSESPAH